MRTRARARTHYFISQYYFFSESLRNSSIVTSLVFNVTASLTFAAMRFSTVRSTRPCACCSFLSISAA